MTWWQTNRRGSRYEREYELLDTGVFNDDRYFDVFVEYAKASAEDILVRIMAVNRGAEVAELHLLPTLWFRNDWAPWIAEANRAAEKPILRQVKAAAGTSAVAATHSLLGEFMLSCEGEVPLLFTDNTTNDERLFSGRANSSPYVKDGINNCVVQNNQVCGESGKAGHQGCCALSSDRGSRPACDRAAAPDQSSLLPARVGKPELPHPLSARVR